MATAGISKDEEKIDIAAELAGNYDSVEKEVTREELDAAFEAYRSSIRKDKPGHDVALEPQNIELQANNKIVITIHNDIFQDPNFLYHLLKEVKRNLNNNQITIETKLEKVDIERSKTSFEEFREMSEENPNLIKLKDELELDFE